MEYMAESQYINLLPSPASLIESLRHIGYSMETAIADLVDNSITAKSTKIWIRFSWDFGNPWIAIIDNGYGMSRQELVKAMKFGSIGPQEKRSREDLGRFGLGMKTASISQCRRFSILSKQENDIYACAWDLDRIQSTNDEWQVEILNTEAICNYKILDSLLKEKLINLESGTIVLWQNFDRLEELSLIQDREKHFNSILEYTKRHLELVFHRYISPDLGGGKRTSISMNENELEAFNPFNPRNMATQELHEQDFYLNGEKILVQPYVLPHYNKVSKQEYEKYASEGGYLHNQGFYIYRNRRLIIWGTWFRLIRKSELTQLIRVRVDIPNTLDHLWKIDIKKSNAFPPDGVLKELHQVIEKIEVAGVNVFKQRGQKLSSSVKIPIWNRRATGGKIIYEINRNYPLLEQISSNLPIQQKEMINDAISIIENSFPKDLFFHDLANTPEQLTNNEFDRGTLEKLIDVFIPLIETEYKTDREKSTILLQTDPFASNKKIVESILVDRGLLHD
jgi:hypothetical protein